jgi:hypothetical protein
MAQVTGTFDISTLLAARFQSVAAYGMDTIVPILQADLAAHNQIMLDLVSSLADPTADRQRISGSSMTGDMIEVDEYGRAPTQKDKPGSTVAFPLKLFQYNVGWTAKWMQNKTPADMATMVLGAEKAHRRMVQRELKRAFFYATNYTYKDHLVDNVDLAVKRLANADSAPIPDGPNGEVFDGSSHNHYNTAASLTAVAVQANIDDVVEHGYGGAVKVAINSGNEAAFRLLTGFVAYIDPRLIVPGGATTGVPNKRLDISRMDNRAIGLFGASEVWVKPWCPLNYEFAWDDMGPKPLVYRQRATGLTGLHIAADNIDYPLYAKDMEAEFGIGVWNRQNGAALYHGNVTWADPSIT